MFRAVMYGTIQQSLGWAEVVEGSAGYLVPFFTTFGTGSGLWVEGRLNKAFCGRPFRFLNMSSTLEGEVAPGGTA